MKDPHENAQQFRSQLYACFPKRAAATFNLIDALASAVQVESPIELSQSPAFAREYPSVYDVMGKSKLDHNKLSELVCKWPVEHAQTISGYEVYAADSTGNPRPEAECLPERILLKSDKDTPAVPGQEYAAIVRVLHEKRSWVAPLAIQRVSSESTASAVAAQQVLQVHQHSPHIPKVITADSRYANRVFLAIFVSVLTLCVLVRLRSNMVLYGPPPKPNPHKPGRHGKHGDKFKLKSALRRTHSDQDETIQILGQSVRLRAWHHLHFKWLAELIGRVICIEFLRPDGTPRYKRPLWLFWSGPLTVPLADICRMYLWRFTIEHFFRFIKQHLGFYATRATLLPSTERWIDIVMLAYWQLLLAAPIITGYVAPWRATPKPNTPFAFTPRQIQLALPAFLVLIGTPAHPTGPAGKAPGRALGFKPEPRPHLKPIRKSPIPKKSRPARPT
jgi:hypothetical protein